MSKQSLSKAARDNRANQLNRAHPAYHQSRGASPSQAADAARAAVGDHATPLDSTSGAAAPADATSGTPGSSSETSSTRTSSGKPA
jgi:hypothetical protein